jgi:LysR family transcriptional regulator, glycine cleavage system transcriptional activator
MSMTAMNAITVQAASRGRMARRSLPPLTALRAFEAFGRLGQMTAAADELCVTHGAISRQIRGLERDCGVRLTVGPRHRLKLTDEGARLASSLTTALDQVERTFVDLKSAAERELHVSCVGTLAMRWLIPRLAGFHDQHPGLRVRVTEAYAPVDLRRQPFDAAIRLAEHVPAHGVNAMVILRNFHGPVVAPRLLEGAGRVADHIAGLPRLDTRTHISAWAEWEAHSGHALDEPSETREYEHVFYTLEAALAGLGVGMSPWIYVAGDIAAGRLVAPLGFVETPARFFFILPDGPAKPSAAAFRDWLLAQAAAAPSPPECVPA